MEHDSEPDTAIHTEPTGSLRVDVFFLPEYYSPTRNAGRSDLRAPRRKVASLYDTQDLKATVLRFATVPGAYFAECRTGRDVLDSEVFEIQPQAQSIKPDPVVVASSSAIEPRPRNRPRRRMIVREAVSSTERELVREHAQRERELQEQLRASEVARVQAVADAKLDGLQSQMQQIQDQLSHKDSTPPEKSDAPSFNLVNKVGEFLFEKATEGDETDAQRLVKFVSGESVEEKENGIGAVIGGVITKAIDNPQGAMQLVGGIMQSVAMMRGPRPQVASPPSVATVPASQHPSQGATSQAASLVTPAEPVTFESELTQITGAMLADMSADASVRPTARRLLRMMKEYPTEAATLEQTLAQPAEMILHAMAVQMPEPEVTEMLSKESSVAWMRALQGEIATRREREATRQSIVQSNGNAAQVETAAVQ